MVLCLNTRMAVVSNLTPSRFCQPTLHLLLFRFFSYHMTFIFSIHSLHSQKVFFENTWISHWYRSLPLERPWCQNWHQVIRKQKLFIISLFKLLIDLWCLYIISNNSIFSLTSFIRWAYDQGCSRRWKSGVTVRPHE